MASCCAFVFVLNQIDIIGAREQSRAALQSWPTWDRGTI